MTTTAFLTTAQEPRAPDMGTCPYRDADLEALEGGGDDGTARNRWSVRDPPLDRPEERGGNDGPIWAYARIHRRERRRRGRPKRPDTGICPHPRVRRRGGVARGRPVARDFAELLKATASRLGIDAASAARSLRQLELD